MRSESVIHDVQVEFVNISAQGKVASSGQEAQHAPPVIEDANRKKSWLNVFEGDLNEFGKLDDHQVSWISEYKQ